MLRLPLPSASIRVLLLCSSLWLLAACTIPGISAPAQATPVPTLSTSPGQPALTAAELDGLHARISELETRIALLERALLAAQPAPVAVPDGAAAPPASPAAPQPSLLPTPTSAPPGLPEPAGIAESAEPAEPAGPSAQSGSRPAQAVDWSEARAWLNQEATVCGPVVATQFAQQASGQPTFLNIGRAFPATDRFQVVIWGNQRTAFPTPPETLYANQTICVTGLVGEYRGTVEVTILGPDEIWVTAD